MDCMGDDHVGTTTNGDVRQIALIGFMGAGKSSVGLALARALAWRFVDLDAVIEQERGHTIREIFAVSGESGFRAAESTALYQFSNIERIVLAVGGGAPVQPKNLLFFQGWTTFYLSAPLAELRKRTGRPGGRPLLDLSAASLSALYANRESIYRSVGIRIDTAGKSIRAVVDAIIERLQ